LKIPGVTDVYDGFTVELLRSCYYSSWLLPGSNGRPILGRYCFSPPGRLLFPGEIFVCSRNYATAELDFSPAQFGELPPVQTLNARPWFRGVCPDPFAVAQAVEAEGGNLVFLRGGEAEGGNLVRMNTLRGGEVESGVLNIFDTHLRGGEVEAGFLLLRVHLVGGEAEGGQLIPATVLNGPEVESGNLVLSAVIFGGGEVESGNLVGSEMAGGEVEGGDTGVLSVGGGEVEAGDGTYFPPVVSGGEVEGGTLSRFHNEIEIEGGDLHPTFEMKGGEIEGGDLAHIFSQVIGGGEVESYFDLQALFSPDLWLDGRYLSSVQGNPLLLWPDRSGSGNSPTAPPGPTAPIFDPSGSGRVNGVFFSASQFMTLPSVVGTGSACTCYAVMKASGTASGIGVCLGSFVNFGQAMSGMTNDPFTGGNTFAGGPSSYTALASGLAVSTYPVVFSSRQIGSAVTVNVDDVLANGNTVATGNPPMQLNWIMGNAFGTKPDAWLYELVFYERAVTDEEDALILRYLGRKWDIPGV
jgi:hypothetical protein